MALIIAGDRSGVGKTTITLALLAYLQQQRAVVQSFKVGPDYIDPMFHRAVTGRPCRNLDPVLTSEAYVQQCFAQHTQAVDYALVEGVMGLFDGASGVADVASTAHVAKLLNLPVLLILDCARLSRSVAAIAHGYRSFDPQVYLAGVVLNRVGSDRHLTLLTEALEPLNLPILGVLRRHDDITLPDRHLGLVPTEELTQFATVRDRLATLATHSFDWPQLLPLLSLPTPHSQFPTPDSRLPIPPFPLSTPPQIAIARDRAFNFYYPENLEALQQAGAELVFWSPMEDTLPAPVSGLYLGGGFPEMFAESLAENGGAIAAVRAAVEAGLPVYAECGGLMYLSRAIVDFDGKRWPMVGCLPTEAHMGKRLTLGYRRAIAQGDTPLLKAGATVWGHEFHRSSLNAEPAQPLYQLRGYDPHSAAYDEGWQYRQVHASYVHLHWGAMPDVPARWLAKCAQFQSQHLEGHPKPAR
ncbi:cobyrinate a,c-diamide synthase [Leptolyngbya sp. AN02str]|uniref:cobyrinate a,c-diamide synthase n=1 Tax=Leptolyngbya sp. AN02str TaxID=3423363 RepID=UPI003D31AB49